MIKTLFVTKRGMVRELTAPKMAHNSWTSFSKQMRLPFHLGVNFWRSIDRDVKKLLLDSATDDMADNDVGGEELKRWVGDYRLTGPLGSQDHVLPVDVKHIHASLNSPNSALEESWKKGNIVQRNREIIQVYVRSPFITS